MAWRRKMELQAAPGHLDRDLEVAVRSSGWKWFFIITYEVWKHWQSSFLTHLVLVLSKLSPEICGHIVPAANHLPHRWRTSSMCWVWLGTTQCEDIQRSSDTHIHLQMLCKDLSKSETLPGWFCKVSHKGDEATNLQFPKQLIISSCAQKSMFVFPNH